MEQNSPNILHLTSSISGGAGIATLRIHNLLIERNLKSKLITKKLNKNSLKGTLINKIFNFIKIFIPKKLKSIFKDIKHNNYLSAYSFYQKNELQKNGISRDLVSSIKDIDILFVHWVSDFVNIFDILYLFEKHNCKVIFVMLDHAHITGGYHFKLDKYNKYLEENGKKVKMPQKNLANKQFKVKKNLISIMHPEIITFSKNDEQLAKNSSFDFKKIWRTTIPIDNINLQPNFDKLETYDCDYKTIFSCAYSLSDYRKGSKFLIQVLNYLDEMIDDHKRIRVLCSSDADVDSLHFKNIFFEKFTYNEDVSVYSQNYHNSDIFLFTSIVDSAPQMPSEALLCGLPIISFDTANIREIIIDSCDGCIIEDFDSKKMADEAFKLLYLSENENTYQKKIDRYNRIKEYHNKSFLDKIINQIIHNK